MRRSNTYIILLLICFISAQENYRSVEQIETEWGEHTTYQRDEMLSFCDFLFNEEYYERCLISCFQFLYRLPDDPLVGLREFLRDEQFNGHGAAPSSRS